MFSNPFPNAFGLDIGDLSIKLVQLKKRYFVGREPWYELNDFRSIDLPAGLIVNGELQKPEEVRKYLSKLLSGTGKKKAITSPWVVASLPETKSFIKLISSKKSQEELIDEDIINAAKKHIPFEEDNYYLQWQIMPNSKDGKETNILIGAVPKLISDSYTYLLESLGLGVVALEIEAIALSRSMVTAKKYYTNEARGILDIGATRSCLIIFDNNTVQFSTSLPYSGELIATALSQGLRISGDEAEEIKKDVGLDYNQKKNRAWSIISAQTNELITGLKNALNFYSNHFPNCNKVTRIIMCGGGANLNRLDRVISAELKIPARPGLPWKNLSTKKSILIDSQKSLSMATAIGLALRAADNPFFAKKVI